MNEWMNEWMICLFVIGHTKENALLGSNRLYNTKIRQNAFNIILWILLSRMFGCYLVIDKDEALQFFILQHRAKYSFSIDPGCKIWATF